MMSWRTARDDSYDGGGGVCMSVARLDHRVCFKVLLRSLTVVDYGRIEILQASAFKWRLTHPSNKSEQFRRRGRGPGGEGKGLQILLRYPCRR